MFDSKCTTSRVLRKLTMQSFDLVVKIVTVTLKIKLTVNQRVSKE